MCIRDSFFSLTLSLAIGSLNRESFYTDTCFCETFYSLKMKIFQLKVNIKKNQKKATQFLRYVSPSFFAENVTLFCANNGYKNVALTSLFPPLISSSSFPLAFDNGSRKKPAKPFPFLKLNKITRSLKSFITSKSSLGHRPVA